MEWLNVLGLNEKQSLVYRYLLEHGGLTASRLAKELSEQRTNIYLIVDALIAHGLVEKDESHPVAQFRATNPEKLQELMMSQQRKLATSSIRLKQAMPELLGLYHLNTAYDGMAYFEGLKGYEAALEEMNKISGEVCVFGATELEGVRPDAWEILLKQLTKRAKQKIRTRILFETALLEPSREDSHLSVDVSPLLQRYMEARFWGELPYEGEIALYDNAVVLTSYDEKLVSLVIKNSTIAATFRAIFDSAWNQAKKIEK